MLIPPRCFTCGNVLADKWVPYINTVREEKNESKEMFKENELDIKFIDVNKKVEKSIEGQVLDEMGLHKYCCRIPFLTNVHLITSL
jgi:DNA-directed RNA polymerase I, II, and III subunit RPABC5